MTKMTKEQPEDIMTFKVRKVGGGEGIVTTDGDYDGEWFESLKSQMQITKVGYVTLYPQYAKRHNFPQYLHHMVLPPKKGYWITFKNGDKTDCRSSNLEYKTPKEITEDRNQKYPEIYGKPGGYGGLRPRKRNPKAKTTSKYRGVRAEKRKNPTYFWVSCRGTYIGKYKSEEEAARQYDKVAYALYGDDAILNFPEEHKS